MKSVFALGAALAFGSATPALAVASFDLALIDTAQTGPSSGTATLRARITNTGDETIDGYSGASLGLGTLYNYSTAYNFADFTTMFQNLNLGVNESLDFDFFTYEYLNAPAGTYTLVSPATQLTLTAGGAEVEGITFEVATFTIDDAVAAVPEPATWGMMLLGFGMVGAGMRRRKATLAAA